MFGGARVSVDEDRVEELLTRGVAEIIPSKESLKKLLMSGKKLRIKLGIDPTSPNIHTGRSVPLLKLKGFQELGHQVVFIAGDFTAQIGDTSDKDTERAMLSRDTVEANLKTYREQVGKILDLKKTEFRKNSEWLEKLAYHDIGEHADLFSLSDFIARENIAKRLSAGKRVSLREILYPLMQGYDSVAVKADVELGGTDQRFNVLAGRPLQEHYGQPPQHCLLFSLLTDPTGAKMSSSWGNTINITDAPSDMFGKTMAIPDGMIEGYFMSMTRVPLGEVKKILGIGPRDAKRALAETLVSMYHGEEKAKTAREQFEKTFSRREIPENVTTISKRNLTSFGEIFVQNNIVASKSELRRLIAQGAVTHLESEKKITDLNAAAPPGTYRIGKHIFVRVTE